MALFATAMATVTTGCSHEVNATSAAPPLKVCGKALYNGAAGAVPTDASSGRRIRGIPTADDAVFLIMTHDCSHGTTFDIVPVGAAQVVKTIAATEAGTVAAEIRPSTIPAKVTIHRADRTTTVVSLPKP
jgi:hypothetical protein